MVVQKTELENVLLIKRDIHTDNRGTFVEPYNMDEFIKQGITIKFIRDAFSTSHKHVFRGIHYDNKTWKLIQCMYGEIILVVVDMKNESTQYLQWQTFSLSDQNRYQVLVPPYFGNGHLVLSDRCIFHYKMSEYYDPVNEKVLRWDDPKLKLELPVSKPILSEKDSTAVFLK